ncbi:unnamed protein product, partial [Cyprideis torosa]
MGWGLVATGDRRSQKLLEVSIPVVPHDKCQEVYDRTTVLKRPYEDAKLPRNTTICAGGEGKDTCQGDSGGP